MQAQKLQLENAGDAETFTVSTCRTVATKFGTKLVFGGIDAAGEAVETPLIPDTTGIKQLDRLGLTPETCVGETLTFSRAANPSGKPYWNIDVAEPQAAPSRRMPAPQPEVVGRAGAVRGNPAATPIATAAKPAAGDTDALTAAYLSLWDRMAQGLALSCATHKVALTADAVQAATATLWIAFSNRGITPTAKTTAPTTAPQALPQVKMPAPSGKRLTSPEPDYSKFPPPNDSDATDDLPF